MKAVCSYNSIVRAAWIAAAFSAFVCMLLLVDFARRTAKLPLDSPRYLQLRGELDTPRKEAAQEELRQLDAQLRQQYFRQRSYTRRGGILLVAGVAVMLLLGHWAATVRRRLPTPHRTPITSGTVAGGHTVALAAVGGLGAMLLLLTVLTPQLSPSPLLTWTDTLHAGSEAISDPATEPAPTTGAAAPAPTDSAAPEEPATDAQIAANWPSFRGPGGAGRSAYTDLPTAWDGAAGTGIRWKTAVPLPGVSSPVVWEKRVFLTGATAERREVYGFDADTGRLLWQQEVAPTPPAAAAEFEVNEETGYAAPTPATDGHRVYAMFANGDLAALDLDGKPIWSQNLGTPKNPYGHAASLAVFRNRVIVQFDQGSRDDNLSRLLAIDGPTGKILWQVPREVPSSWASPIVAYHEGQPRIVTAAAPWVIAYDPEDGRELWRVSCLKGDVGPSPIALDGLVYVSNDRADTVAIRDGGEGDVTASHVLWKSDIGLPDTCSPLATDKYVIVIASYGALICYDRMQGGEPVWEEDFGAMFGSSPSLVGEQIYLFADDGHGWVIAAGPDACQRVAENTLGEPCFASPAFQAGRIYLRGKEHLFCIGPP